MLPERHPVHMQHISLPRDFHIHMDADEVAVRFSVTFFFATAGMSRWLWTWLSMVCRRFCRCPGRTWVDLSTHSCFGCVSLKSRKQWECVWFLQGIGPLSRYCWCRILFVRMHPALMLRRSCGRIYMVWHPSTSGQWPLRGNQTVPVNKLLSWHSRSWYCSIWCSQERSYSQIWWSNLGSTKSQK